MTRVLVTTCAAAIAAALAVAPAFTRIPLKPVAAFEPRRLERQRVELGRQVGRFLVRGEPQFAPAGPARLVP
jgi:hypothetical protein